MGTFMSGSYFSIKSGYVSVIWSISCSNADEGSFWCSIHETLSEQLATEIVRRRAAILLPEVDLDTEVIVSDNTIHIRPGVFSHP